LRLVFVSPGRSGGYFTCRYLDTETLKCAVNIEKYNLINGHSYRLYFKIVHQIKKNLISVTQLCTFLDEYHTMYTIN